MEIATAFADITPDIPRPLVGYIARTSPGRITVESDLQVNITGLRNTGDRDPAVIVVAIDTLFLDDDFVVDLALRLGRPELADHFLVVASHTHGAPNLQKKDFMKCPYDGAYRDYVLGILVDLILPLFETSSSWEQLTAITARTAPYPDLVCRRRIGLYLDLRRRRLRWGCHFGQNPDGITDPFLRGIEFHGQDGVRALWWSLPAHPAFFPNSGHIHADFPGVVRQDIRRDCSKAALLFLPGFAGSVIPKVNLAPNTGIWWRDLILRFPLIPGLGHFSALEFLTWASNITACWKSAAPQPVSLKKGVRLAKARISTLFRDFDPAFGVNIAQLDIGSVRLLCMSGEPVAAWQKHLLPFVKDTEVALLTGYIAGPAGYIATPDMLPEGGYEVDGFQQAFAVEGCLSTTADKQVHNSFQALEEWNG